MAADFDKVLRKLEKLREEQSGQKENWFHKPEHHELVIDELQSVLDDMAELKTECEKTKRERDAFKKEREALEKKRAEGHSLAQAAAEHLQRIQFLDGWGGQALALSKLACKVLGPLD